MVELKRQNYKHNKSLYNKTKKELLKLLDDDVVINHVGSTAIPNMIGKNIIDILIGVKEGKFKKSKEILTNAGYFPSEGSATSIYQFFATKQEETKSQDIHLHLVCVNTERYNEFIILKNYLLNSKEEAKNYSNFKKEIINLHSTNRKEYRNIKSKYVSDLIERAKLSQ